MEAVRNRRADKARTKRILATRVLTILVAASLPFAAPPASAEDEEPPRYALCFTVSPNYPNFPPQAHTFPCYCRHPFVKVSNLDVTFKVVDCYPTFSEEEGENRP